MFFLGIMNTSMDTLNPLSRKMVIGRKGPILRTSTFSITITGHIHNFSSNSLLGRYLGNDYHNIIKGKKVFSKVSYSYKLVHYVEYNLNKGENHE